MIKKIKFIILLSFIFIIGMCTSTFARITTNDPTVKSGEKVTIKISSQEPVASGAIKMTSNSGLTFQSASGGTVNGSFVAFSKENNVTSGIVTYTFKAPEVTETKTYKIVFSSQDMADENGNTVASSSATATVTVKAPETQTKPEEPTTPTKPTTPDTPQTPTTKSNDATLKSIKIGNKTYSGSSLKNTISYTAEADVSSIKITATKNNSQATVSGTGTKSLVAGQTNKFKITVTAEDGTKKTYNINIIRLAEETTTPNVIENENPVEEVKLALTSLVIKDVELNVEFNPETYNYIANVKNMNALEIVATANKEGAQINIEGASELKEGDNIVKVTAILGEEKAEYIIDVYNVMEDKVIGVVEDSDINSEPEEKNFVGMIRNIIMENLRNILLIVLVLVLSIIAIRYALLAYKYSNKLNELMGLNPQTDSLNDAIVQQKSQNKDKEIRKNGRHF